ncbi:MAG: type VI secretion system tip protein VgrG [Bacteroidota bacterium]
MALASSIKIEIAGQEIEDYLEFYIDQKMHGLQEFNVTCRLDTFDDPDDSVLNKSKEFIGSTIVIKTELYDMGWSGSQPGFAFKGFIHSVRAVKSDIGQEDLIVLQGYSPDFLLQNNAGCSSFENKSLKQIADTVLKPYPRDILATSINPKYKDQIPYCVKYNENSLDFLKRLATRYGEWMYYNGKEFIFGPASGNQEELVLGEELKTLNFSINLNAPGFKYVSYDYLTAKAIETEADKNMGKKQQNEVGKLAHDQSWKHLGQVNTQHYPHLNTHSGSETKLQKDLVEIKTSAITMGMSVIEATSENMNLVTGSKVGIKGIKAVGGHIDYGEYIIISIQHRCDNLLNYENSFTAIPSDAEIPPYANPEAVSHSEPQSAVVTDNKDPENLGRVKVKFIWQEDGQSTPWIRTVTPYSANGRGFYFIPEIDDEVLVGFEDGNAEKPYVIGSLYHGKNKPPDGLPDSKNNFKGIVTKSNLRIEFDEGKKVTTIDTPGGNKIVVSDDEQSILLNDQNDNKVELSPSGIELYSLDNIKINSDKKITIEALEDIVLSSLGGDIKVSGMNIKQNASVDFKAEGSASAEVSGADVSLKGLGNTTVNGGIKTTIQGGVVMIN